MNKLERICQQIDRLGFEENLSGPAASCVEAARACVEAAIKFQEHNDALMRKAREKADQRLRAGVSN